MRTLFWVGALALVASACPITAAPLPDAVPVEVFAALPTIEGPELSPDGTKILGRIAVNGKQMLIVQPLFNNGKPSALAQGKWDLNWWRWINDDWLVVGVGDTITLYDQEEYFTTIVTASADMKKVNPVDQYNLGLVGDDVIWIARDGSPRFLLSKETGVDDAINWYPSVFDVDASTGHVKKVVPSHPNVWNWAADGAGNVRYGVLRDDDGKRIGVLYRGPTGGSFQRVMLGKREENSIPEPIVFKADGSALARDDGEGRDAIYELHLPDFKLGKKVFGDPKYDVDDVVANPAENDLSGVQVIGHYPKIAWLDPNFKDIQDALDKTLGPGNSRIISWSRDRTKLLVEVGPPSQAGALYYWNTNGAAMQRITWNNKLLKDRTLSPVSTVEYKARDGVPIEAVLTLPRGREAKGLSLIVMPHGGPGARDDEEYDWWVQFLAEEGYAVIQPNYRGSTGYGKAFHDLGNGQWGLKMEDDLLDAITYLSKQGVADPKRVCIVGASYGGYAAMRGAQRDGAFYRCAVSFAGISDLGAMLRYDRNLLGKEAVDYWKKQVTDFTAVSPRFHAADFGAPILIAHGVADKRVPVKQSRMLVAELQKAGKPYDYLEQKLGDHHFTRADDRLEFLKKLKAFLDKYNPA
ncbi:MAG TPA: S9 family peptidase [Sphingomicrobium sp.]|nr:S9 family peptidase [Sphingomicrobium sp.]